jgi:2-methylisocitrate lyase-like PEP mutase family enzyme
VTGLGRNRSDCSERWRLARGMIAVCNEETLMTDTSATQFHQLHQQGLLVLPNAWDAGSARIVQAAGAQAVATSSAAVAWAHGFADGHSLPSALLLQTTRAISAAVALPVSVDAEGGYSDDPQAVAELVQALMAAGAVGINIEDGGQPPPLLVDKIRAIRQRCGASLYINARCDVYLRNPVPPEQRVAEVLRRAAQYQAAGASGLFVPRIVLPDEIAQVAAGTSMPLNVMACPGLPDAEQLRVLGVRRVSAGSSTAEAVHGAFMALCKAFLVTAQVPVLSSPALGYGELNALMKR